VTNIKNKIMKDRIRPLIISTVIILLIISCNSHNETFHNNETIARQYIEAWNNYDSVKVASLFSENYKYEDMAFNFEVSGNRDTLTRFVHSTILAVPDSHFEISSIIANDSMAVVEWTWKGTVPKVWFPNDSTGKKFFTARGISLMEIQNGLIKRNTDYYNSSSIH